MRFDHSDYVFDNLLGNKTGEKNVFPAMQFCQIYPIEEDDGMLEVESMQQRVGRVIIACCCDGEIKSSVNKSVEPLY